MYHTLIAIIFCVFAGSAAAAQCEAQIQTVQAVQPAQAMQAGQAMHAGQAMKVGPSMQAVHAAQPAGQVIRASVVVAPKMGAPDIDVKDTERGGTAALLIALAMMSGIALRRYTNAGQ